MSYTNTPEYKALQIQFHKMWTAAVGTDGYDKREWKALDTAIYRALEAAAKRAA